MGESITQAIVLQTRAAVTRLLGGLEAALRAAAASATDRGAAAAVDGFARLVASVRIADLRLHRAASQERPAVCRFWDAALRVAGDPANPLAEALAALMPWLSWTQNPN